MIQIYYSSNNLPLLQPLPNQGTPGNEEALQWQLYADSRLGHSIIVALDLKTDYSLCFTPKDSNSKNGLIEQFLRLLSEHILRVCDLSLAQSKELGYWIRLALQPVDIHSIADEEIEQRLKQQTIYFINLLAQKPQPPTTNLEWFQLALPTNRHRHHAHEVLPLAAFQDFWMGLWSAMQTQKLPHKVNSNNVIPFKSRPK